MPILDSIDYIHVVSESQEECASVGLRQSHWFRRIDINHVEITAGETAQSGGTLFMDVDDEGERILCI